MTRKRPHGVYFRVNEEELKALAVMIKKSGLPQSLFFRYTLFGYPKPMSIKEFGK